MQFFNTSTFHTFLPYTFFVRDDRQFIHDILLFSTLFKQLSSSIKEGLNIISTFTISQKSNHTTMEARLLTLITENERWHVTNSPGVLISQAHVKQPPPCLPSAVIYEQRQLMNCLTSILEDNPFDIAKPGWSKW